MSFEILLAGVLATLASGISLGVYFAFVTRSRSNSRTLVNMWTTGWSFLVPLALAQEILPTQSMPVDIWLFILGLWGLFSGVTVLTGKVVRDARPNNY